MPDIVSSFCCPPSEVNVLFNSNLSRLPFLRQVVNLDLLLLLLFRSVERQSWGQLWADANPNPPDWNWSWKYAGNWSWKFAGKCLASADPTPICLQVPQTRGVWCSWWGQIWQVWEKTNIAQTLQLEQTLLLESLCAGNSSFFWIAEGQN